MPYLAPRPPNLGAEGFIHDSAGTPAYWMQDILWIMPADRDNTGGRRSMMGQLMPRGAGPSPHNHLWSDETFFILEGAVTILMEGEVRAAEKGASIIISRNRQRAFRVDGDTAGILDGYGTASMEAMTAELDRRTPHRELPPPRLPIPVGKRQMPEELLHRYGLVWPDQPILSPRGRDREKTGRRQGEER